MTSKSNRQHSKGKIQKELLKILLKGLCMLKIHLNEYNPGIKSRETFGKVGFYLQNHWAFWIPMSYSSLEEGRIW